MVIFGKSSKKKKDVLILGKRSWPTIGKKNRKTGCSFFTDVYECCINQLFGLRNVV
jgi:hypothetical protein